jgi:glycosyltransferase involved in cell wall biosynthesis
MKIENKIFTGTPLFSIIIVSYNSESLITNTLKSLLNQSYKNYEIIIIDGNSKDKTIKKATNLFNKDENSYLILKEKDNGIYDAMNKGINLSIGSFIFFLNCGDEFANKFVLENISNFIKCNPNISIFYGDIILSNKFQKIHNSIKKPNLFSFILDRFINHQAIFSHRDNFKNNENN